MVSKLRESFLGEKEKYSYKLKHLKKKLGH